MWNIKCLATYISPHTLSPLKAARAGVCARIIWTVNPAHFDLIGQLNHFENDEAEKLKINFLNFWSFCHEQYHLLKLM